jgi:hypothetical protein
MINMSVGNDDVFDLKVMPSNKGENILDVIAGVNDHGLTTGLIANNRAVALKRAYGEDLVDHFFSRDKKTPRSWWRMREGSRRANFENRELGLNRTARQTTRGASQEW